MGSPAQFSVAEDSEGMSESAMYLTFVSGLIVESVMVEHMADSFTVTIPMGIEGQSYVFLTTDDVSGGFGNITDAVITNGPAIIEVTPAAPAIDLEGY